MKAVRFDEYGSADVLTVADVPQPQPGQDQVLVKVRAAGINPGEAKIRAGELHAKFPAAFPSGEGSDLAGTIESAGEGVTGFEAGDEVIGWVDTRSSHAEYAVVAAANLTPKPAGVPWEVAGALAVAGSTAWAAVAAVDPRPKEIVVVAGAAGGVGSIAVQLARRAGATVVGLASESNRAWLEAHGVIQVGYGDGVADRIRAVAGPPAAFIDAFGGGYVELAIEELGVAPTRIDTIARFDAVATYGVKAEGSAAALTAQTLRALAELVAKGELEVPIAAAYPLAEVRAAYAELAEGHTRGKIVLIP